MLQKVISLSVEDWYVTFAQKLNFYVYGLHSSSQQKIAMQFVWKWI